MIMCNIVLNILKNCNDFILHTVFVCVCACIFEYELRTVIYWATTVQGKFICFHLYIAFRLFSKGLKLGCSLLVLFVFVLGLPNDIMK